MFLGPVIGAFRRHQVEISIRPDVSGIATLVPRLKIRVGLAEAHVPFTGIPEFLRSNQHYWKNRLVEGFLRKVEWPVAGSSLLRSYSTSRGSETPQSEP